MKKTNFPIKEKNYYIDEKKIDLCCGDRKPEGFFGIDIIPNHHVNWVCDLDDNIPWAVKDKLAFSRTTIKSNSVEHLRAFDALEHLHDKNAQMSEIFRICKDGARIEILVPSTDGRGAFQDPTHVTYWNANSFLYYCIEYPEYLILNRKYGFKGAFKITNIQDGRPDELKYNQPGGGVIHTYVNLEVIKRDYLTDEIDYKHE